MDPIDIQQIQELETLRTLWKLAIWAMGIILPSACSLIVYFYNRGEKWRDQYVAKLEKDVEILKMRQ